MIYEAAGHAGGRCRSFRDDSLGCLIDNGSHMLMGANEATRTYLADIGSADGVTEIAPASFPFHDLASGERWRLNVVLNADFDTSSFSHVALYNETLGCIQMFLESTVDQSVRIGRASIEFRAGERIHTENSYKYDPGEFTAMVEQAGFRREAWWTDERDRFAIFLLTPV